MVREMSQGHNRHTVRAWSLAYLEFSDGLVNLCQSCQLGLASRHKCKQLHELLNCLKSSRLFWQDRHWLELRLGC